jgi:uncharacterized protein (DUF952 family)
MRRTYHLVPAEAWEASDPAVPYAAPSLGVEGFIHCTDGDVELLRTAERYYRADPRPYLVLTVDLDRCTAPWTVEDPAGIYPHVHGPIDRAAIVAVARMVRGADGAFLRVDHGSAGG